MKIIHVASRRSLSGVERFIEDLATCQGKAGNHVTVVMSSSQLLDSYATRIASKGVIAERLLPPSGHPAWHCIWRLLHCILSADILHVHQDWHGANMGMLLLSWLLRRGRGLVVTDHIRPIRRLPMWQRFLRRRITCPHIAVSETIAECLEPYAGVDTRLITHISTGIDISCVQRQAMRDGDIPCTRDRSGEAFIIVFVGRLVPQKNVGSLIDAVRILVSEHGVRCKCHIVGDGIERNALARHVETCGLDREIILHGYLDNPYPLMACADVLCLPSFYEGTPLCVLEALALGVPCVVTPVDGLLWIKRQVTDGIFVCKGFEPIDLAETLSICLSRLQDIGSELPEHVRIAFSMEGVADRIHQIYLNILEEVS